MNILFALHKQAASNSGLHVTSLARELDALGHDCVVATPGRDGAPLAAPRLVGYADVQAQHRAGRLFRDGRGADIFHAWTPRGLVQAFHEEVGPRLGGALVIHLEDNEDELVRSFLGASAWARARAGLYRKNFPRSLMHPVAGRAFLGRAAGITVLIEALRDLAPPGIPAGVFWPAADDTVYYPRPPDPALRQKLGLPAQTVLLAYTGNAHPANAQEVRSLYLATHLLNRRSLPARLVRTGSDAFGPDAQYQTWARTYALELGHLEDRRELGALLAAADVLVQPGRPGPFNDYRFPSKLPEFFASGRPVVLPRTNIGLVARHREDAFVLPEATGPAIADAVAEITRDASLAQRLAQGARAFYEQNFSWHNAARAVATFYQNVMQPA
ncbi:MAG: glycosyltransferase family 4 protein [Candidatus Marinimicrobia bacterium]|nr:glycosyltransferase family 4 protein [Candidatus Neomarinimicrobiota bacterium]